MVCPCLYPLVITDKRYDTKIEYIAIPTEIFEDMQNIDQPEFEEVEEKGFDGHFHKYIAVMWKDPKEATTKKYEINDHIVIAGCDFPRTNKGKLKCYDKEIYVVLHPIDEWTEHHIVSIQ